MVKAKTTSASKAAPKTTPTPKPRFVPFGEALKNYFKGYITWSGRATRAENWWPFLVIMILNFILNNAVAWIVSIATFLPTVSVSIRRFHDVGISGVWYLLLMGVTFAGVGILSSAMPISQDNPQAVGLWGVLLFVGLIADITIECLPSQPMKNKYGDIRK